MLSKMPGKTRSCSCGSWHLTRVTLRSSWTNWRRNTHIKWLSSWCIRRMSGPQSCRAHSPNAQSRCRGRSLLACSHSLENLDSIEIKIMRTISSLSCLSNRRKKNFAKRCTRAWSLWPSSSYSSSSSIVKPLSKCLKSCINSFHLSSQHSGMSLKNKQGFLFGITLTLAISLHCCFPRKTQFYCRFSRVAQCGTTWGPIVESVTGA